MLIGTSKSLHDAPMNDIYRRTLSKLSVNLSCSLKITTNSHVRRQANIVVKNMHTDTHIINDRYV